MTAAIEAKSRRHDLQGRANQLAALLRCLSLAEENETAGLDWKGLAGGLELAEEIVEGLEAMQRQAGPLSLTT